MKKYRIIKKMTKNQYDDVRYYPQSRTWYGCWIYIKNALGDNVNFFNIDQAYAYIDKLDKQKDCFKKHNNMIFEYPKKEVKK